MHKPPSFANADKLAQGGDPLPLFAPPAPAQAHSETSKAAARSMKSARGRTMMLVLETLRWYGDHVIDGGQTDEEIQNETGLSGNTERPARVALVAQGLVKDSGRVRKTASGRNAVVWVAVARTGIQG